MVNNIQSKESENQDELALSDNNNLTYLRYLLADPGEARGCSTNSLVIA